MSNNKRSKKLELPSDEAIESNKGALKDYIEKVVNKEIKIKPAKEKASEKLMLIKDELLIFKDKNVPYRVIRQILIDKIGLTVSEHTLRIFCQKELNFTKQERNKKNSIKEVNISDLHNPKESSNDVVDDHSETNSKEGSFYATNDHGATNPEESSSYATNDHGAINPEESSSYATNDHGAINPEENSSYATHDHDAIKTPESERDFF